MFKPFLLGSQVYLKIATQAIEAGDFFIIYLRFLGFSDSFYYKIIVIKKRENFQWSELEAWFEVFKLVQDLVFCSLENKTQ